MSLMKNETVPDNIPNPETRQSTPAYKPWGWYVIDNRTSELHLHERDRLSSFFEESFRGLTYLTTFCFFLPQLYTKAILIPQYNNIIKGDPKYVV